MLRDAIKIFLTCVLASTTLVSTEAAWARTAEESHSIKLLPSQQVGSDVDKTTRGDICAALDRFSCQAGKITSRPGGFRYLSSVAVTSGSGDLYVADNGNNRIQIFEPTGMFLAMFGWNVNRTKVGQVGAMQFEKNICTAHSGDDCTSGREGTAAGQFANPASVSVDPVSGDVYVAEISPKNMRIDKYTANGHFLWMVGQGVNKTTAGNVCTLKEIIESSVKCGPGQASREGTAKGVGFKMAEFHGNVITAGGPDDLLYVGDEGRVQEFDKDGLSIRNFAITAPSVVKTAAIAVDEKGYVYVVYEEGLVANVIRKFNPKGEAISDFVVKARPGAIVSVHGLAIDLFGRLAVIGGEEGLVGRDHGLYHETYRMFGALYDATDGHRLTEFTVPVGNDGIAFGDQDQLYVAATDGEEVLSYLPVPSPGLVSWPLLCKGGGEDETSVTFDCGAYGGLR